MSVAAVGGKCVCRICCFHHPTLIKDFRKDSFSLLENMVFPRYLFQTGFELETKSLLIRVYGTASMTTPVSTYHISLFIEQVP